MPRKSVAAASVVQLPKAIARLSAPDDLSTAAERIWAAIVTTEPAEHFRPSDVPLLKSYVECCALADEASAAIAREGAVVEGRASPWLSVQEKAIRSQNTLAVRLRLSPSARIDPKTVGRSKVTTGRKPWDAGA